MKSKELKWLIQVPLVVISRARRYWQGSLSEALTSTFSMPWDVYPYRA